VEPLDPPKTGPVTGDVVRRRGRTPLWRSQLSTQMFCPPKRPRPREAQWATRVAGLPAYPRRRTWEGSRCWTGRPNGNNGASTPATNTNEGELDVSLKIREKLPTPLEHTGNRVPWQPSYPLPQRGAVYVHNFLTEVDRSRREGRGPDHESHATGAGILPKRSNRRQGLWSDLHKQQRQGFLCHLGREWVATYRNLPNEETGEPRFTEDERTYGLKAMQHLVADLGAHYARLPNQPDL
jgi:hypothetical protein